MTLAQAAQKAIQFGGIYDGHEAPKDVNKYTKASIAALAGQGLIAYAFAHLPASLSAVSLLLQPVMAALFAWALFAEAIGPAQFAGGAIVLAGIWLARRGS
jgi:drug/metabolite transporter (DMT)-like permease